MEHFAVYPGTFDPITNGHVDVIERSLKLFDRVVVAVAPSPEKKPLFSLKDRLEMAAEATRRFPNVSVDTLEGLLVNYVLKKGASAVLRGIRAYSDFEYEFQMALMNRHLDCRVETVFLMPSEEYAYVTSSHIKAVASHGGNVAGLVPKSVEKRLAEKLGLPGGGPMGR